MVTEECNEAEQIRGKNGKVTEENDNKRRARKGNRVKMERLMRKMTRKCGGEKK